MSETDLPLQESWQVIRGLEVYDITHEQIGSVEDLYVDREARQPRFLIVSAGGFLGIGKKHFLIPVEVVSRQVGDERVRITQPRDKVVNSPTSGSNSGVPGADLQRAIDAYYSQR